MDDRDYQVPFKFAGKLNRLTLSIERPTLTPDDEKKLMEQSEKNMKKTEKN